MSLSLDSTGAVLIQLATVDVGAFRLDAKHIITAAKSHKLFSGAAKKSANAVIYFQQLHCLMAVKHFYAETFGFFLQSLGHKF